MRTKINTKRAQELRYMQFKGYSVPSGKKKTNEEHFVVPWELDHSDETRYQDFKNHSHVS
ncbi:MAG: hypothetical protein ABFS16_04900 [Bacteroidota bacterium]